MEIITTQVNEWHKEVCLNVITLLLIWQLMLQVSVLLACLATYLTDGLNLISIGSGYGYTLILFGKFVANEYSERKL